MASNFKRPAHKGSRRISYALLARFSELLICARCFRHNVSKPVRQVFSSHHRPLAMCHECSHEVLADRHADVINLN